MVQKPKAVKYKVVAGYLLLFGTAVLSVWFFYKEILKIAIPAQTGEDSSKIIQVSNIITDLYATEATGRGAILTGSAKDYDNYTRLIDGISSRVDSIKQSVEPPQAVKFDSIKILLARKKKSIADIFRYRAKYDAESVASSAKEKIYDTKDSLWDKAKKVRSTQSYSARPLVYSALTPRLLDSLSKLQLSGTDLTKAYSKALDNLRRRDDRRKLDLLRREQKLLDENRIISDQLRVVLASVEQEFLQKSYAKIGESRAAIAETVKKMAWIGAVTLFFLIVFAWFIVRDLTSNQNYRKQLEILNHENESLLRSKTMLMATVTHDLQTPLGSIIGFHDLIKQAGVSGRQHTYLDNIRQSADYILKLVNDLLDFSKLENNRITVESVPFNVKKVVESTCMALEPMAVKKNIELNWVIDDKLDGNYMSDPYRIKQVLTNLVSNAIKFTNEGSVEVSARIEGFDILISVLDTGIGISADKHDEVFREFTQAHEGIEKKFGGTGLGLTISKRILELLGGSIVLESKEGQGSIFTMVIPCIAARNQTLAETTQPTSRALDALGDKRVLIVDDDTTQLALMRELLANYCHAIRTEPNAAQVMDVLSSQKFDIVLTDIQMPGLDGFGLVSAIRNHPDQAIAKIPVIALSGKRDLLSADYIKRGFSASHPKPVQFEGLLELMSSLVAGHDFPEGTFNQLKAPESDSAQLYNLESLSKFTNNDRHSLATILNTFIESATENCSALKQAAKANDMQMLSATAHKMIPMLKQMEVQHIVRLLVPLEDNPETLGWTEIAKTIDLVCEEIHRLCDALQLEMA